MAGKSGTRETAGVKAVHLVFFLHLVAFLVLVVGDRTSWWATAVDTLAVSDLEGVVARPWSLLTCLLLNDHPFEFVVATGFLLLAGVPVEERLGRRRVLLLYAGAGLLTALAHVALVEAGLLEVQMFRGSVGAAAGLVTAYLFLFGGERQVGSLPYPVFYLIVASGLFTILALVDHYNGLDLQASRERLWAHAHLDEGASTDQRLDDLAQIGLLERQRPNPLGHMFGLVLGAVSLASTQVLVRAHQRYRIRREIRDLELEVDARARVDLLLEKINREGIQALTRNERRFLRYASRFFKSGIGHSS